jgi:hypothetical protein
MSKSKKSEKQKKEAQKDCIVPKPMSLSAITKLTLGRVDHKADDIRAYVELESPSDIPMCERCNWIDIGEDIEESY